MRRGVLAGERGLRSARLPRAGRGCRGRPGARRVLEARERAPLLRAPAADPDPAWLRAAGGWAARTGGGDWAGGARGDVTGSGPGRRNRAAAAAVAQQRAAAAERAGTTTPSGAPGTRQQPERPPEGRRARWPPPPPPPRGAPARGSPATWSFLRPQPLQVRGRGEGAKPPPPAGRDAPRCGPGARGCAAPRRARGGRLLVLSTRAGRAKFARLAGGGHRTREPGLGRATPARARTPGKGRGAETWGSDLQ